MQALKIVLSSILAAIAYGVIHDQFTARFSIEYFTIGHVRLFASDSPTLHALAWGVIATWWVGLVLGVILATAARLGSRPKLELGSVLPTIIQVMLGSAVFAVAAGLAALIGNSMGWVELAPAWKARISTDQHLGFFVDSWIHLGSYSGGCVFGLLAGFQTWRRRRSLPGPSS